MVAFRKFLILTHRYLGIAVCLLFAMWFVSGIAMIFARGMPGLTPEVRFQHLPVMDTSAIKVSPAAAAQKAQLERSPNRALLLTVMDRPAYRCSVGGSTTTVFADSGDVLESVGEAEAIKIASRFMNVPGTKLHYAGELLEPDQWTLEDRRVLPAHKITVDDPAHTVLYVSEETAEVALLTTRGSRAFAWFAAIPHWMYFAPLRQNGPVWRQVVLWTSGAATVLALIGIILGFTQCFTRYAGLMRWHYVTGVLFGVFCVTWVFSGLLSMEPFFWASGGGTGNRIAQALRGGPLLVSADSSQSRGDLFSTESLMMRVKQSTPDVPIAESVLLSKYDSYYHPTERKPPLPVLRVKFADSDATWIYIDAYMSQVVTRFTRRERLQRWIYHGLHSLDFNFWYYQGRAWTTAMVFLNAGGAVLSVIGVILACKRVSRSIKRMTRHVWTAPVVGTAGASKDRVS